MAAPSSGICAVTSLVMIGLLGFVALLSTALTLSAEAHPSAEISNGPITAKIYLPDPDTGYYRGTRFDWSGAVYSLTYKGHEFFGEWQQSEDPYLHDRITGPVEEYLTDGSALGYNEVPVGGLFLRIGVGLCEKPEEEGYRRKHSYKVVDPGIWTIERGKNWIEFVHKVAETKTGYGYRYTKRLTLSPQSPELIIDHVLVNTGDKIIETSVYNHNFFVIDNQPTGPDFVVRFPFDLRSESDLKGYASVRGNEFAYLKEIPTGDEIMASFVGHSGTVDEHRFTIENRKVKAGVRMATDKPLSKLLFWSPNTTLCPEPFIDLAVSPGQADRWSIRYEFYTLD